MMTVIAGLVEVLAQARTAETVATGDVVVLSWSSVASISAVIAAALGGLVAYMRLSMMAAVAERIERIEAKFMPREVLETRLAGLTSQIERTRSPASIDKTQRILGQMQADIVDLKRERKP
jgi:hypothetical protein